MKKHFFVLFSILLGFNGGFIGLLFGEELDANSLKEVKPYKNSPSLGEEVFRQVLDVPPPTSSEVNVNPLRESEKIQNATEYINTVGKPQEVQTKALNLKSSNTSVVDSALNYGLKEAMPLVNLQAQEALKKISPTLKGDIAIDSVDKMGNFSAKSTLSNEIYSNKNYELYGEMQTSKTASSSNWNQIYTVGQKIKASDKVYLLGTFSQYQGDSNVFNQGVENNPQVWSYGVGYEPSDNFSVFVKQSHSTGGKENTQGGMNYIYRFGGK